MNQATIWKYAVEIDDVEILQVPGGDYARIIHADQAERVDQILVWILCPVGARPAAKTIRLIGTGHYLDDPDRWTHAASVVYPTIPLVWHLFETAL